MDILTISGPTKYATCTAILGYTEQEDKMKDKTINPWFPDCDRFEDRDCILMNAEPCAPCKSMFLACSRAGIKGAIRGEAMVAKRGDLL